MQINKITHDIPNKIKQPSQCCKYCGKSYKKRERLNSHIVVCELLQMSKKKKSASEEDIEAEMEADLAVPSQKKMYEMLIQLGEKYNRLEEKMEEMNKWVVKKKKKINALEWLNTNVKPNNVFDTLIDKIIVNDDDVTNLLTNNFYDVLQCVFSRSLYSWEESEVPIMAFAQKICKFYVYDKDLVWVELTRERLTKFLNRMHSKIFKQYTDWKKAHAVDIRNDSSLGDKCNKALVKIMSVEIHQDAVLDRIKNAMFSRMKKDIKSLVEYEFEF